MISSVRNSSAYGGARTFFGLPFAIAGAVMIVGAVLCLFIGLQAESAARWVALGYAVAAIIGGLFFLSIPALAGAIFDMADCSLRNEAREAARDAKAAYDQYRRNEELLR